MSENHNYMNDDICMVFLKSKPELALKEGDENRVSNAIALDKSDIVIDAIDFTIEYMTKQKCSHA